MCLAIPTQVIEITNADNESALVELDGVTREVNVALVRHSNQPLSSLIGQWVIVHAGFAISAVDEEEALRTLTLMHEMQQEER